MFPMRYPRIPRSAACALLTLLALCGVMTGAAQARIFIGIGVPLFFPPVYVPPPVYYPPIMVRRRSTRPQATRSPTRRRRRSRRASRHRGAMGRKAMVRQRATHRVAIPRQAATPRRWARVLRAAAQSCQAGAYVCPLVEDTPPGGACSCPGQDGRRIGGRQTEAEAAWRRLRITR